MAPGAAERDQPQPYGRFPERIERDWLGRWCHLSEADVSPARRRGGDATRLGFAAQLVTVRAIGTFLADPSDVPSRWSPRPPAAQRRPGRADRLPQAGGPLEAHGRDPAPLRLHRLRGRAGAPLVAGLAVSPGVGPTALFRAAHRRMLAERVLLPGEQVLARLVGSVRKRATQRLWSRLAAAAPPEVVARIEDLLVVPEGRRRSELDRVRRPPFSPTIIGLVQALERLAEVRALATPVAERGALLGWGAVS